MIPNFVQENGTVLLNEPVAMGLYRMRLDAPRIARTCRPAQFVQVQTDAGLSPFLRRPFSVLRADRSAGWIEILYDVVGAGTRRLAEIPAGRPLSLVGPLGNAFPEVEHGRLLLVAGGVGLVPLVFLTWTRPEKRPDMVFLIGAACRDRMPDVAGMIPPGLQVHLSTDDGSLGHRGFVTERITEHVLTEQTVIFTCGPHAMMARTAAMAADLNVPCYASLENHMACGFGACVGCAVEYRDADREDERYRRVCVDGPVMDAHKIVW